MRKFIPVNHYITNHNINININNDITIYENNDRYETQNSNGLVNQNSQTSDYYNLQTLNLQFPKEIGLPPKEGGMGVFGERKISHQVQ